MHESFQLLCILAITSFHGDISRNDDVSKEVQIIMVESYHMLMLVTSARVESIVAKSYHVSMLMTSTRVDSVVSKSYHMSMLMTSAGVDAIVAGCYHVSSLVTSTKVDPRFSIGWIHYHGFAPMMLAMGRYKGSQSVSLAMST